MQSDCEAPTSITISVVLPVDVHRRLTEFVLDYNVSVEHVAQSMIRGHRFVKKSNQRQEAGVKLQDEIFAYWLDD